MYLRFTSKKKKKQTNKQTNYLLSHELQRIGIFHKLSTVLLYPYKLSFCIQKPLSLVKADNSNDQSDIVL
jgi:hypothetical protein